ncbi:MAG: RNA methyltransferase [Candidatus Micrarchaeia archaeon]
MKLKLIIVDPKYQLNVGYIARTAKNFGIDRLYFVKPRANINGKRAIMYSKHANELIKNAKIYKNLEEAMADCDVLIGTTGVHRKNPRLGRFYTPEEAVKKIKKEYRNETTVGLVIGRDDTGLNSEELALCDIHVHINTNHDYPILNISHSVAILLYEFRKYSFLNEQVEFENAQEDEIKMLFSTLRELIKNKKIRDKEAVVKVFRKMLRKSQLDRHEIHAIISALK